MRTDGTYPQQQLAMRVGAGGIAVVRTQNHGEAASLKRGATADTAGSANKHTTSRVHDCAVLSCCCCYSYGSTIT